MTREFAGRRLGWPRTPWLVSLSVRTAPRRWARSPAPRPPPRAAAAAPIEGTVRDAASGRPCQRAGVHRRHYTGAATSETGTYRIANAPVGPAVQLRVRS